MKIARINHHVKDGKVIFKVEGDVENVPFAEVPGIDEKLKEMNIQRYYIRRSKKTRTLAVGKRFK